MDAASSEGRLVEVEVEFDYEAELQDELTIRTGDVITEVKRLSGGWWEGQLNGKRGLFPDNFVKVLTKEISPKMKTSAGKTEDGVQLRRGTQRGSGGVGGGAKKQQQRCRVLFSYQPKHEDELELKMDEVVDFLSEVEDGWWKGKLKGKVGVFPSNFVEMITASIEDTSSTSSSSVIDKNKKNEKMKEKTRVNVVIAEKTNRVSSKISSLIQEAESKATKKKSTENLNLVRRESPLGSETEHKANKNSNTDELLANAPKLPPKPVKELCSVLFPYNAVNDDELSLEEGQIVTIITKDVEDKGWWKGEIDGRVGVFPDNFVKVLPQTTTTAAATAGSHTEEKQKRPLRPPVAPSGGKLKDVKHDSLEDVVSSSSNSSREKLNGSSDKLNKGSNSTKRGIVDRLTKSHHNNQPVSLPPSISSSDHTKATHSPKKHSFGKSTPPPKPKPPAFGVASKKAAEIRKTSKDSKMDKKSENNAPTPEEVVVPKETITQKETDLDSVQRGDKLAHPTADRVRAPKRRPPSSVFVKESKLSGDAFEALDNICGQNEDEADVLTSTSVPMRSASQGSLHDDKDNVMTVAAATARQENKNRLSFKLVKQQMKEVLGGLTNGDKVSTTGDHSKEESKKKADSSVVESPKKIPPPKPPLPAALVEAAAVVKEEEPAKKPDWLAELSRKQANRKSGLFSQQDSTESATPPTTSTTPTTTTPPAVTTAMTTNSATTTTTTSATTSPAKPTVVADKPHIPLKPSQIREEARKSQVFTKRTSSESSSGTTPTGPSNTNDKENSKPSFLHLHSTSPPKTEDILLKSKLELSSATTTTTTTTTSSSIPTTTSSVTSRLFGHSDTEKDHEHSKPAVITSPTTAIGWKPSILQTSSNKPSTSSVIEFVSSPTEELDLSERVKRLEQVVKQMQVTYDAKFEAMQEELENERLARHVVEKELNNLKKIGRSSYA